MTTRELPREEWGKIVEAEAGRDVLAAAPSDTQIRVVVVEDEAGAVVGSWLVYPAVHVEGFWIAEAHRGRGSVLRRLLLGMTKAARTFGVAAVMTQSMSPKVDDLVSGYGGTMLQGRAWWFPLREEG